MSTAIDLLDTVIEEEHASRSDSLCIRQCKQKVVLETISENADYTPDKPCASKDRTMIASSIMGRDDSHLSQCVKDEAEIPDSCNGGKSLFINIAGLLNQASPDVVICQAGPQASDLYTAVMGHQQSKT